MKIKELKHNHSLTDLLKVLLFSILMLAPILAIGVKCGYVVVNKNANQSYSDNMIEKQYKQNDNQLIQYQDYIFTFKDDSTSTAGPIFYYNNISIKWSDYGNYTDELINGFNFYPANTNNRQRIKLWYNDTEVGYTENIWGNNLKTFTINFDRLNITNNNSQPNFNLYALIYHTNKLDNVFYYAIDEVAQEPLFNWTQNTAIYTGVNAMCTGMEITSPIIPILITYWFLLTCIYVIIDILIKGFTMLTHLIGSKLA